MLPQRRFLSTPARLAALVILPLGLTLAACGPAATSSGSTSTGAGAAASPAASATKPAAASGSGGTAQQLTVKGLDTLKFDPPTLTGKAGQPIQVTLQNDGATIHDFTLTQGVAQPVKIVTQGHQQASATFTVEKPGTYTFVCDQPGHEAAGMKGTLTIQ